MMMMIMLFVALSQPPDYASTRVWTACVAPASSLRLRCHPVSSTARGSAKNSGDQARIRFLSCVGARKSSLRNEGEHNTSWMTNSQLQVLSSTS
jgi:hypothetical protein